jgi:hypothetical protein
MREQPEAPPASAPPTAVPPRAQDKLPPLPLAAAGLAALNGFLTVTSFALFFWDAAAATPIIQRCALMMVLAGIAGVVTGGVMLVKNKRSGFTMEGTQWANPSIIAGLLMMVAAVFLPLAFALSMLVNEGA